MNRLIDDLRAIHRVHRPRVVDKSRHDAWQKYSASLWPMLKDPRLLVVTINAVAIYYWESEREMWNLDNRDDFKDLTPPRPLMWFEYRFPERMRSEGRVLQLVPPGVKRLRETRTGALVITCRRDQVVGEGIPEGTKLVVMIETFFDYGITPTPEIEGPQGAWTLALDDDGRILEVPYCQSFTGDNQAAQKYMKDGIAVIHPPLLALSWLPRELPEDKILIEL